jgi:hypothetical protein
MLRWLFGALVLAACQQPTVTLPTYIRTADPRAANQLLSGFHSIEEGRWRWTAARFSAESGAPSDAAVRGVKLRIQLYVSKSIEDNGGTTLSCALDGAKLQPEPYSKTGAYAFVRDTPPVLSPNPVLTCSLSRPLPPSGADARELGIVIDSIALDSR